MRVFEQETNRRVLSRLFLICGRGLWLGVFSVAILSCSPAADVKLRGPEKPKTPSGDVTTPAENPSPTPNSTPEPNSADNGSSGTSVSLKKSYRLFCDDRYPSFLTVISSKSSASGFGSDLDIQVFPENQPLPIAGGFDSQERNLEYHKFPQPIEIAKDPHKGVLTRFIFSALPTEDLHRSPSLFRRNIYVTETFLTERIGRAQLLSSEMQPSAFVESLADQEGFSSRTFGVSDGGKYLLALSDRGLSIYDSKTLRGFGEVKWSLPSGRKFADYFAPALRESDMSISVSFVDSQMSLSTEIYQLSFNSRSEVQLGPLLLGVSNLRRPLVSLDGSASGVERLYFGLIGGNNSTASAEIVLAEPARRVGARVEEAAIIKSFPIEKLPAKGRIPSAMTVWKDSSGSLLALVAVEDISQVARSGLGVHYKVEEASLQTLVIDEGVKKASPISISSSVPYPQEVRTGIEKTSVYQLVSGIKDLQFSPDKKALYALLPGAITNQIYQVKSTGLDRISQEDCSNLSIGVEP